ncbi:4-pyridoxate dehydrogenase-like [Oppia nitens]|uniref:4-pyridoxate dehydrogenase-like n=1 Tax=Oppia nitens TaxID=1686743 RepID=UPI0023DB9DE6|nr:4-pyridoxate dehydrogenase-like [Oppia nitens]
MLSGVGPKQHLKNKGIGHVFGNIPVGNNYCDQVSVNIDFRLTQPNLAEPMFSLDNISQLYQVTVQGKGLMSEKPNTMMYWSTKYNNDTTYPDIYMYLTVNRKGSEPAISSNAMANSKTLERQIKRYSRQMISNNYVSLGTGLVRPVSCGTIRLNTSSINDQPLIDPNFLANPSDRLRLREAIADTFHFVETTSFGRYVRPSILPMPPCQYCPDVPIYRCNTYIDCLIDNWAGAEIHPVGSCRMGDPHRTDTVVDPRLRVKAGLSKGGVHRLRVVDASIYPEIINANTNAAAMLAGEMGAQFIHKDNKGYK